MKPAPLTATRDTTFIRPDFASNPMAQATVVEPAKPAGPAMVATPAAVAAGLWMRVGFVGASVCAAGLASLFAVSPTTSEVLFALVGMALGGGISIYSWRRVGVLLEQVDAPVTANKSTATDAPARPSPALQ